MAKTYGVMGTGMQGRAAAYGLAKFANAKSIVLLDRDTNRLKEAQERLSRLVPEISFETRVADAKNLGPKTLAGIDGLLSAASYTVNLPLSQACIEAKVHMVDLGGNTGVVKKQLELSAAAKNAGVTIIPDQGLAPGLGNILAVHVHRHLPNCQEIQIRCGGLPQKPEGSLQYHLVFSIEGLVNEYLGHALVLENGVIAERETLDGLEELNLPSLGKMEAFFTSGGISTLPYSLKGRVKNLSYKTVRYPGHCEKIRCIRELGLWDETPLEGNLTPRAVFQTMAARALTKPAGQDLVVLRVSGQNSGGATLNYFLLDYFDKSTGFSAMERTTAFPAALVLKTATEGALPAGVHPVENVLETDRYLQDLEKWGIRLQKIG